MGYAATRSLQRVAAAMGTLQAAPVVFEPARDIPQGGVLLAVPALLTVGLLRHSQELYRLGAGFYGLSSVFLLLAQMALARIQSLEQSRYLAPGEWGHLLGLDRIPEVRTLREKVKQLCLEPGRAARWNAELAREWMGGGESLGSGRALYIDGHVRVYHGRLTKLPRHHVARERMYLRATTDYWINALDGQPFFYFNKEVDHGLVQELREEIVPWLEEHVPCPAAYQQLLDANPDLPRFTLVFDREGYSPQLFLELAQHRIAALTYHRYPKADWPREEFQEQTVILANGETVRLQLAERAEWVGQRPRVWMREIRKLAEKDHQVAMVTTNFFGDAWAVAVTLMARWSQENYFKYMREHFGLDGLAEYGTEEIPATVTTTNPAWRTLDRQVRQCHRERRRCRELQTLAPLPEDLSAIAPGGSAQQQQTRWQERIDAIDQQLLELKAQRKQTPHHIPVCELPEDERFTRLRTERKHFIDTIRMISYRAETSLVATLREKLARTDDARSLVRQIFHTEVDLILDPSAQTLTVCLHHLAQAAHDAAARHLCEELTATETTYPGTALRLIYRVGSP